MQYQNMAVVAAGVFWFLTGTNTGAGKINLQDWIATKDDNYRKGWLIQLPLLLKGGCTGGMPAHLNQQVLVLGVKSG